MHTDMATLFDKWCQGKDIVLSNSAVTFGHFYVKGG